MLFKILQYMKAANVPVNEFNILCLEPASTLIVASVDIDSDEYKKNPEKTFHEIRQNIAFLYTGVIDYLKTIDIEDGKVI